MSDIVHNRVIQWEKSAGMAIASRSAVIHLLSCQKVRRSHHFAKKKLISEDMLLLGQGRNSSENVDRPAARRSRHVSRRCTERRNPSNVQFERQVAALEARQEQEQRSLMSTLFQPFSLMVCCPWTFSSPEHEEDGDSHVPLGPSTIVHDLELSALPSFIAQFVPDSGMSSQAKSAKPNKAPDLDFLDGTYINMSSGKKQDRKSKKNNNNKKKNKKGKCKKDSNVFEIQYKKPTDNLYPCNDSTNAESLALLSNHIDAGVVMLEHGSSSFSPSSQDDLVLGTGSDNEIELISSSNYFKSLDNTTDSSFSCSFEDGCYSSTKWKSMGDDTGSSNEFRSLGIRNSNVIGSSEDACYTGKTSNRMADHTGNFSLVTREWPWSISELSDSRYLNNCSGGGNKPKHHQRFCLTISSPSYGSGQEGSNNSDATSDDGFQQVVSRKKAQTIKKMQLLGSSTYALTPQTSKLVPATPQNVTIGHCIKGTGLDRLLGRKDMHKMECKYKGLNSVKGPMTGFNDDNVPGKSGAHIATVHQGKLDSSQIALSLASLHVVQEAMEENSSSECLPKQEDLKALPLKHGDAKDTDSKSIFCSPASVLDEMIKASNHAYEIQVASDVYTVSGHPIADFETLIHSATPVIGQISCTRRESCLQDQLVHESQCQDQISSIALRSLWEWYEEPGCFGLEVEIHRSLSSGSSGTYSGSEFSAYYVPSLSAIQLFGQSNKLGNEFNRKEESSMLSPKDGQLMFEYFELEKPSVRTQLFIKIGHLAGGVDLSSYKMYGDPKKLESAKLSDLHPASWFCVAWYPVFPLPPERTCRAAFLTYHSLGKVVPQTWSSDMADGSTHVVCPIVGLLSYNEKGDHWFELRETRMIKQVTPETSGAEVLKERLKTLRHAASVMSKAVVPRATGEAMNHHPDYEFFQSRSSYD
ncbi:hypothetical protein ACP4OV_028013 [Aristida adscensionis]